MIGGVRNAPGIRSCRCNARGSFAQLFSCGGDRGSECLCDTSRMSVAALPDLNVLPADALRALILAQHQQLLSRETEIEHLKLLIAKLQRMQFGPKSEKLQRQIEQLELRLEELQANREEASPAQVQRQLLPSLLLLRLRNRRGVRCQSICRAKSRRTRRSKRSVIVAASCASWAKTLLGGSAGQEACTLSGVMNRVTRALIAASSVGKTQLAFLHRSSDVFLISAYASLLAWLFHSYAVRSLVQPNLCTGFELRGEN